MQKLFVEAFAGDVVEAMQIAGYKGEVSSLKYRGEQMLTHPDVVAALNLRTQLQTKTEKAIANREERQAFWTAIMRNKDPHAKDEVDPKTGISKPPGNIPLAQRLKASEYLGKSEADFMERLDVTGNVTVTDIINQTIEVAEEDYEILEARELAKLKEQKEKRNKSLPSPGKGEIEEAEIIKQKIPMPPPQSSIESELEDLI